MKQYIATTNIRKQESSCIIRMKKVIMLPAPYGYNEDEQEDEYGYSAYCAYGFYNEEYREC